MQWIFDSPWTILLVGLAIEALLAVFLLRSGKPVLIGSMVAVGLLTAGLLVVERVVVTDEEEVSDTLDGIAAAMESGDVPQVMAGFSPNCARYREIQNSLSRYKVRKAHVGGDLQVRLNRLTSPPSATAYFTGRIEGRDQRGEVPYEHIIRKFKLTLQKPAQQWLIAEVEDADPRAGVLGR